MVDSKRRNRSGDVDSGKVKRLRVSRACDQCRAAREKCDGIQPICFTCATSNRSCSYTTNPKRRGIQPGYIRTLELTLAWTLVNVAGCEDALTGLLQDEKGQQLITSVDGAAADKLHRKWRKNVICRAIDRKLAREGTEDLFDQVLTTSGDEEDNEEDKQAPSADPNSVMTPDSLKATSSYPGAILSLDNETTDQVSDEAIAPPTTYTMQSMENYVLPSNHWRLIEIYFAYTHSWLPTMSKEHILKLCYSYPTEGLGLDASDACGEHAELWSILALAAIQEPGPGSGPSAQSLLATAKSFVRPALRKVEIGHISALLTLSLVNIAFQRFETAWILLGRAIRHSSLLQVKDQQRSEIQSGSSGRLKIIILGCFVVETMLAATLHLIPNLRSDVAISLGLVPEEGLEEWQPWAGCEGFQSKCQVQSRRPTHAKSTFNQIVKLCYILNSRYVVKMTDGQASEPIGSLSQWLGSLPGALGPLHQSSLGPEQTTPQSTHLFLAYLVGRALVTEGQISTVEECLTVLDHFTFTLGAAAMPPLFACFLHILRDKTQSDGFQYNRLAGILSRFTSVWRPPLSGTAMAASVITPTGVITTTPIYSQVGEGNDHVASGPSRSGANVIAVPQSPLQLQQSSPMHLQHTPTEIVPHGDPQAMYGSDYTAHYKPNGPMDPDALFDDFTSFEGGEPNLHPQFMQNLGFAPNANLAELMMSDYGWGFNPG